MKNKFMNTFDKTHKELIENAEELGLKQEGRDSFRFTYKNYSIDLSASPPDSLSIMKNVAQQLVNKLNNYE